MRKDYVNLVSSILKRKATFLALFFPTKIKKPESSDPPFYVDIEQELPIFTKKFKIISLNSKPNSIKPRLGSDRSSSSTTTSIGPSSRRRVVDRSLWTLPPHCNGKYSEMLIVAKNSPLLSSFVVKKTSQLLNIIR